MIEAEQQPDLAKEESVLVTRQLDSRKVSRRNFNLALTVLIPSMLSLLTACGDSNKPSVNKLSLTKPDVTEKTASLSEFLQADLITRFQLQGLASVPIKVYELHMPDGKPTYIYPYDRSTAINIEAMYYAYDVLMRNNLIRLSTALMVGKQASKDYVANPKDPESTFFRYNYGLGKEVPVGVGILSFAGAIKQRHMLILSETQVPQWASDADAGTREYSSPGTDVINSQTFLTIINTDKIKKRPGSLDVNLTWGALTEVCNQNVKAITMTSNGMAGPNTVMDAIGQEGVCNGLGYAATLRRLGLSWRDAEKAINQLVIGEIPGIPSIKPFPVSKAAYELLPNDGLPLTAK